MGVGAWIAWGLGASLALYLVAMLVSWVVLRVRVAYDEVHEAEAGDGVRLALYRLRGEGTPVLLVHGMGVTHRALDVDPRHSLARALHAAGRDVWLMDLRGRGGSRRGVRRAGRGKPSRFVFDDYVLHDLPAALACVRERTGHARVHYVGYSMGGGVGMAYLSRHAGAAAIASFVSLAGVWPPALGREARDVAGFARKVAWWGVFRLDWLARIGAWHQGWTADPMRRWLGVWGETTGAAFRRAIWNGSAPISLAVVDEFLGAAKAGAWRAPADGFDYDAGWAAADLPCLFLAGDRDRVVAPRCVRGSHEACGSPTKELLVLGPDAGCVGSYGHVDVAWGERAPAEVFPRIAAWIDAHDGP